VAYVLVFFYDGHRAASDCRATLHALAQPLPGTGRFTLEALLQKARLPTWRLWARDAAIESAYHRSTPAKPGTVIDNVASVTPGSYAIQAYHDENDNLTVDRNFLGISNEAIGFSNNAPVRFSGRPASTSRPKGSEPRCSSTRSGLDYRDPNSLMIGVRHVPHRLFTPIFSRLRRECLHFVSRFVRREQE
jgi:hypothetical protein